MDMDRVRAMTELAIGVYPDGVPGGRPYNRRGLLHHTNRNNLGITLDLTQQKAGEVFKRLAMIADVVASGCAPNTSEKLGVAYPILKEVKPDIIMFWMPAYGATCPECNYTACGGVAGADGRFDGIDRLHRHAPERDKT
jgi:crotonobetainyl-CoA:carnitine CoA-transferase CaiB-like acyl-CoA transferase